jgi:hypothetical protein
MEIDEGAREIRNLAGQKGERVPGKKEAHAMGWLVRSARTAVREYSPDVKHEKILRTL